jgi:hypothetical protein
MRLVSTSTIPTAAKMKGDCSSWAIVTMNPISAPWDRPREGKPMFLAIAMAGKVVVDCVGLYVVVIRVGDAAQHSRFSLGDPSL